MQPKLTPGQVFSRQAVRILDLDEQTIYWYYNIIICPVNSKILIIFVLIVIVYNINIIDFTNFIQ